MMLAFVLCPSPFVQQNGSNITNYQAAIPMRNRRLL
jgi:hypothetical protein